jgi:hypothetical protein
MSGACPNLSATNEPTAIGPRSPRPDGREIATAIGLAHANAERHFATADGRQKPLLQLFRAESRDQWSCLSVSDPVMADGRAPPQQLLDDDEPIDRSAITTAIGARERHADPPAGSESPRERGIVRDIYAKPGLESFPWQLGREELAHLPL